MKTELDYLYEIREHHKESLLKLEAIVAKATALNTSLDLSAIDRCLVFLAKHVNGVLFIPTNKKTFSGAAFYNFEVIFESHKRGLHSDIEHRINYLIEFLPKNIEDEIRIKEAIKVERRSDVEWLYVIREDFQIPLRNLRKLIEQADEAGLNLYHILPNRVDCLLYNIAEDTCGVLDHANILHEDEDCQRALKSVITSLKTGHAVNVAESIIMLSDFIQEKLDEHRKQKEKENQPSPRKKFLGIF